MLDNINGYSQQVTASGLKGRGGQPAWDTSTFRPVPYVLRGMKPITREPWAVDQAVNRDMDLEGFSVFGAKLEDTSAAGDFQKGLDKCGRLAIDHR